MDDYIMFLLSFFLLVYLKNEFPKFTKIVALGIVFLYVLIHGTSLLGFSSKDYLEYERGYANFLLFLPTFYFLLCNRKYKELVLMFVLATIFATGKFISTALPILAFTFYLDFLCDDKFKYQSDVLLFLTILFLASMIIDPILTVKENIEAFNKFCDLKTKICNNTESGTWHFGHYFAYLGYISNNPDYFGFCTCVGKECLIPKIDCGG